MNNSNYDPDANAGLGPEQPLGGSQGAVKARVSERVLGH